MDTAVRTHGSVGSAPAGGNGDDGAQDVVEINLRDPKFRANAYDVYADLRERGPVTKVKFRGNPEDGDASHDQARTRFRNRETFWRRFLG